MKQRETERSGVARCQKCFKYGHLTYECKNESAYRYRPSRTMQYKEKLMMQAKASTKPPKSNTVNPDYKRRITEDGPSSDSNDENENQIMLKKEVELENEGKQEVEGENEVVVNKDEDSDSSSSDESSSSSSSSNSSSSESESLPRKKKPE